MILSKNNPQLIIFAFFIFFPIVEKVDNTAYMHAKTMNGQHSVAFLIKLNNETKQLSVEGKSTEPSILASLTDEIRDMDL